MGDAQRAGKELADLITQARCLLEDWGITHNRHPERHHTINRLLDSIYAAAIDAARALLTPDLGPTRDGDPRGAAYVDLRDSFAELHKHLSNIGSPFRSSADERRGALELEARAHVAALSFGIACANRERIAAARANPTCVLPGRLANPIGSNLGHPAPPPAPEVAALAPARDPERVLADFRATSIALDIPTDDPPTPYVKEYRREVLGEWVCWCGARGEHRHEYTPVSKDEPCE